MTYDYCCIVFDSSAEAKMSVIYGHSNEVLDLVEAAKSLRMKYAFFLVDLAKALEREARERARMN